MFIVCEITRKTWRLWAGTENQCSPVSIPPMCANSCWLATARNRHLKSTFVVIWQIVAELHSFLYCEHSKHVRGNLTNSCRKEKNTHRRAASRWVFGIFAVVSKRNRLFCDPFKRFMSDTDKAAQVCRDRLITIKQNGLFMDVQNNIRLMFESKGQLMNKACSRTIRRLALALKRYYLTGAVG